MTKTQYKVYMNVSFNSNYPTWLLFLIFLKRGHYNGPNWKIRWGRILCWFDKHKWEKYVRTGSYVQCERCGESNK